MKLEALTDNQVFLEKKRLVLKKKTFSPFIIKKTS